MVYTTSKRREEVIAEFPNVKLVEGKYYKIVDFSVSEEELTKKTFWSMAKNVVEHQMKNFGKFKKLGDKIEAGRYYVIYETETD